MLRNLAPFCLLCGAIAVSPPANAEIKKDVVRIGILNDQSSVFSDGTGVGSVVAARLAVEDFGGKVAGKPIEVVFADHLNKPDVGSEVAQRWFDRDGVDTIVDIGNSAVALAVLEVAKARNKAFIPSGSGSTLLTGKACSNISVQWTFDTWGLGSALGRTLVGRGGKKWFFIVADYNFGKDMAEQTSAIVRESGGQVLGEVRHPLNTSDFSSFLLQAQAAHPDVIAFGNGGADTIQSLKQSHEFGLGSDGQMLVGLAATIVDIESLGLPAAQGTLVSEAFYWDLDDAKRSWSKRWAAQRPGRMPTELQAGVYSAVLHFLKAVDAARSVEGDVVVAKMKEIEIDDPLFGKGSVRADGRAIHQMFVFQVKRPEESHGPWDFYNLVATIPPEKAFRPLAESECPLVKKG